MWRWIAYTALALGVLAVCIADIWRGERLSIEPHQVTLPGDGAEHVAFRIRLPASLLPSWLGLDRAVTQDTATPGPGLPPARIKGSVRPDHPRRSSAIPRNSWPLATAPFLAPSQPAHSRYLRLRLQRQLRRRNSRLSPSPHRAGPPSLSQLVYRRLQRFRPNSPNYPRRSMTAPPCSALPIAKRCTRTTKAGWPAILPSLSRPRPRFGSTCTPKRPWAQISSACAPALSCPQTSTTAASPSLQMRERSCSTTPTSSVATSAKPAPAI